MRSKECIYGLLLLILPIIAISCLDDGGNQIKLDSQPAVVKLDLDGKKFLILKGGDSVYAESLDNNADFAAGDCGLADFELDFSDGSKVQSTDSAANYYIASSLRFTELVKHPLYPELSDTSLVDPTEMVITNIHDKTVLLENNLFLFTDHTIQIGLKEVDFSYDKESKPTVEEDGKRVYDIYMRISGDTIGTQKEIKYNVLALDSLIHYQGAVEQAVGKDTLNFRINYLSAIKSDSTPFWKTSKNYMILLPKK